MKWFFKDDDDHDEETIDVAVIIQVEQQEFPSMTEPGNWKIYFEQDEDIKYEYEDTLPFNTFEDVEIGAYTIYAVRLDSEGEHLGQVVQTDVDFEETTSDISVATGLSVFPL